MGQKPVPHWANYLAFLELRGWGRPFSSSITHHCGQGAARIPTESFTQLEGKQLCWPRSATMLNIPLITVCVLCFLYLSLILSMESSDGQENHRENTSLIAATPSPAAQ